MLRTAQTLKNVITIYHNPAIESSLSLVKFAKHKFQGPELSKYDLQITEQNPTPDQLKTLQNLTPMLKGVKSPESFPKPTLVSWFNGKVAVGNEERARAILNDTAGEN